MADGTRPHEIAGAEAKGAPSPLMAENLKLDGITHGFFLRTGGVSDGIYASLNCGRGSHDVKSRVEENRARVALRLGVDSPSLVGPRQIHSPKAVIATVPWTAGDAPEADAVVTRTRGLAISVLAADCVPILMADAEAGVIAAVHAGWKGAKAGVIECAIEAMESLGARPSSIAAAIGPAISPAAYEVGHEFRAAFLSASEDNEQYFLDGANGRPHFDLPAYVKERLSRRGISRIQKFDLCTYENESILFSHRRSVHRSEPDYGRQISAILIG